ncbi:MAG: DNA cytosine methyltransferase [Bacteroidales bacterium]|jgi:DNA (cytosine-5)-methyltransferase 1
MTDIKIPYTLEQVNNSASRELFTVISTFAGGGGSSTGYKLSGGKILAFNEFVEEAITTYLSNYPNTPHIDGDIKGITGDDFLKLTNLQVGELDIFDGSPPCSAFSAIALKELGWNKTRTYSDKKKVTNIEDLFLEYIRIANDIQPKVMVAENVSGLLVGASFMKFIQFLNAIEKNGYTATYFEMNAKDYGTSQSRGRVFIVAVRNDVMEYLDIDQINLHSLLIPNKQAYIPLHSILHDIVNDVEEVELLKAMIQRNKTIVKYANALPHNASTFKGAGDLDKSINPTGHYFNLYRSSPYTYCPILTAKGQQLTQSGVLHYNEDRKFTIVELKRIMGLPDDYQLTGTFNQKAERIGRMVAPLCISALIDKVYEHILKPYNLGIK